MSAELIPLKAGQHSVTLVPRATTNLPFFYLTKQKIALNQNVDYQGVDILGRPIRWQVFPNTNPAIGAPGIDAHEAWMRLVKPAIDIRFSLDGLADIVPLGSIRASTRAIGWGEGGWEARRLLKALHQISAASCIADLWIPTTKINEQGEVVFHHINATFSKLTIYSIGTKHLTEEQLQDGQFNFDFDLDDTLYVQLHPIEAQIQHNQPHRLIDNQYLFSVKPASRRWYELVAPKIFGVVKNKGNYCEIRYSWYVKHHHTLTRQYTQKRVVFQMSRIIQDHLATGYISKVEYRKIKEPDQELDWIIRYYPGEAAKESIARILSYQYNKRSSGKKERVSIKTADLIQPAEQGSEQPQTFQAIPFELSITDENHHLTSRLIIEFGITAGKALELVRSHPEQAKLQLEAYSYRKPPTDKAGWIIRAIENSYTPPEGYIKHKEQHAVAEAARQRREAIDACPLCNDAGYRMIKATDNTTGQSYEAFRECSHEPAIEIDFK